MNDKFIYVPLLKSLLTRDLDCIIGVTKEGESLAERWWNSSNKHFQMQKPIDVLMSDPAKVSSYIQSFMQ